jgi:hypothetical protein
MDPVAVDRSVNRCFFFYPNEIHARIRELLEAETGASVSTEAVDAAFRNYAEAQRAAYARTGAEDDEHQNRVAAGQKFAYEDSEDFRGMPHPVEEAGIFDFEKLFACVEERYQALPAKPAS